MNVFAKINQWLKTANAYVNYFSKAAQAVASAFDVLSVQWPNWPSDLDSNADKKPGD